MRKFFFFSLLFSLNFLSAQNLVLDPGFEIKDSLRSFSSSHWTTPTAGTTDYYLLPENRDLNFFGGSTKAHSGKGFAGLITYQVSVHNKPMNYREYTTGQLSQPLEAGVTYLVTFFIELGKKSNICSDALQISFTNALPASSNKQEPLKLSAQLSFDLHSANLSQGKWVRLTANYAAHGGELYFTVGNFLDDAQTVVTKTKVPSHTSHPWAYYYIDDFYVSDSLAMEARPAVKDSVVTQNPNSADTLHIAAGKILVANSIYFGTDSSILKKESFPVLDEIISAMKSQPSLKVEIDGHTDAQGTSKHNDDLSLARANAVADYFTSHGIEKNRVTTKGFGSSKPLVKELTDDDRAKNRRVEFIFSE
jgi:outer membrane protein OmpA-like peptidoglycan-associated protein